MKNDDRAYPSSQITTLQSASVIDTPMNERALPRWPFRLALFATTVLIAGSGALLFGIAALKRESLWHVTPWQGEIVGTILCTTAALAIAALGTGVGSLLQNPDTRTPWSYACLLGSCWEGILPSHREPQSTGCARTEQGRVAKSFCASVHQRTQCLRGNSSLTDPVADVRRVCGSLACF